VADPVRPLLDGGASAVEDNRPGRNASGGTGHARSTPPVVPPAPSAQSPPGRETPRESSPRGTSPRSSRGGSGSAAPLTVKPLADVQSLTADELPDGLVVADGAGRVVVYNRAAVRLTGIAAEEAIGKYVYDVLPLKDDDGRDWWMFIDPYHGLATRTRHPERSLFLASGAAGHGSSSSRDSTELLVSVGYVRDGRSCPVRRLVITLRGAQQRARLERSRAELVSTVAHELRAPLTSVKGFTATLLAKWSRFSDDQKRVMLETVNADADHVTRLITELLDVSRIESGRMEVRRQLVDVPERARKIIAGRVASGESEDRFRLEAAHDLPETWLDADKIDQILGNLVENAVRHGAGIVTVVVQRAQVPGDQLSGDQPEAITVSVRDQGEGIPPEMALRVFRQFWRGKRRGGTGLGLYIVKGLVEAMNGEIAVARAPGGGAEFRFTLPAGTPALGENPVRCPAGTFPKPSAGISRGAPPDVRRGAPHGRRSDPG
jgi:signal transduction histidine kinase